MDLFSFFKTKKNTGTLLMSFPVKKSEYDILFFGVVFQNVLFSVPVSNFVYLKTFAYRNNFCEGEVKG
jgi:hypothetical protein